ncbi:MAG: cell division protein FtsQ/DivIB [Gammaproteobacteria bacterium]
MQAAKILLTFLLLAGAVWAYGAKIKKIGQEAIPIKYVRTEGVFQYIRKEEIKAVLLPLVKTGILGADMQAIHDAVAKLPWVETVSAKRVWPDAIAIKVREKKPYVRWGSDSLIDEKGVIFTPHDIEPFRSLPVLIGPEKQQIKALEIMKGVETTLEDRSLKMTEFRINDRWSWQIKLATGLEILLGRNDQLKKLERYLKTQGLLGEELRSAMTVADLRYPNGFSVSWKPGSEKIDWKAIANPHHDTERQPVKATQRKHNGKKNRT